MIARTRTAHCATFLVALTALLLIAGGGTKVASGALSPPNTGIGVARMASGNTSTLTNTDRYSVLIVGHGNADWAGTKPGRALTFGCGVNIPNATWSAGCGVSWADAVANNWLLKDANGNYVPYGDGYSYLADIGNPSFQQRWISDMDVDIRSHPGVDGVFIDNIVGHLIRPSVKYPDSSSYRAAILSFIRAVGPALKAKGWYVTANLAMSDDSCSTCGGPAGDGSQWIWWAGQVASSVNAFNMERWQQLWDSSQSVRVSGSTATTAWAGFQRLPGAVQGLGKDFFAMDSGAMTDTAKMTYLKASFLLDWNGGGSAFIYAPANSCYTCNVDVWNPAWTLDIGQPSGAKFQVGVGWGRKYTGGAVVVNPNPSTSQAFSLGATYLTASGTAVTSVTLSPATAMILRSSSLTPTSSTSTSTTTTTTPITSTTTPSTSTTTATPTTSTTTPINSTTTTTTTTPTPTPGWSFCAWEYTRCAFAGTMEVRYGANGTFTSPRTFTGGVDCNNSVFGDPVYDVRKWCEMRAVSTTTSSTISTTTTTTPTSSTISTTTPTTPSPESSPPSNKQLPTIKGPDMVSKTLKSSDGSWVGANSFAYVWSRCDSLGRNCLAITGAKSSTYLVAPADLGRTLVITVIATNAGGGTFATSLPTAVIRDIGK